MRQASESGREYVWNLRSGRSFRRIRRALAAAKGRSGLRMLAIRMAKALNAMMSRAGKVFADHFHSRLLRSPTELVRAIRYVLTNAEHHYGASGLDDYTSGSLSATDRESLLSLGVSWLLRVGIFRAKRAVSGGGG